MIYRIKHITKYSYTGSVFLEPHILHLYPPTDGNQKIRQFSLAVKPEPAGIHHFRDAENNGAICVWFAEKTDSLVITTTFEVETLCLNPFTYLVTDHDFMEMPVKYEKAEAEILAPYRSVSAADDDLLSFGRSVAAESNYTTLDFLNRLCQVIYQNFTMELRKQGAPLPPAATLQTKKGACRDLVILYMAVCRNFGLATRFVSGYQEGDPDMENRQLHAWAEVYVPGGGWRGYDPSHGLVVSDRHIALAASYNHDGTIPVQGNFRGTSVTAAMDYTIFLNAVHQDVSV